MCRNNDKLVLHLNLGLLKSYCIYKSLTNATNLDMWSLCHLLAFIIFGQDMTTCFSLSQATGVLNEKVYRELDQEWL